MRRGQATVEYMITMSVVSIAIIAIMLIFNLATIKNVRTLSESLTSSSGADASDTPAPLIEAGVQ